MVALESLLGEEEVWSASSRGREEEKPRVRGNRGMGGEWENEMGTMKL